MAFSCPCPCGCVFLVEPHQLGGIVHCPTCARALHLEPGAASRPSKTWLCLGIAGGLLLTLLGVLILFVRDVREDSAFREEAARADVKLPDRVATREGQLHRTVVEPVKPSPPVQRMMVPTPRRIPSLSAPQVARTDPDQPRAGQPFTFFLTCPDAPGRSIQYEYREGPAAPWKRSADGQVRLNRIGPGSVRIEFRVVDSEGRSSPVAVRTLVPAAPPPPFPNLARLRAGEAFYQEVIFDRQSQGQALSIDFRDNARFALLSRIHVDKVGPDGSVLSQKVEAAHVARALPALEAELNRLLRETRGATFRITINRAGEVAGFEGNPRAFAVKREAQPGGLNLWMQSTLDADAWKELAALTFFQPQRPLPVSGHWLRPLHHHWGPLGQWDGQTIYTFARRAQGLERYEYRLDLKYRPPDPRETGLPFRVGAADFRLQKGGGSIVYDAARGRVRTAEEQFQVRGVMTVEMLGVTAPSEMAESQHFELTVFDHVPANWRPLLLQQPDH